MSAGGAYGITWPIDGPPPVAPKYTLLKAARVVDDLDRGQVERWMNGVEVYPYPPGPAHTHDACASGSARDKDDGETVETPVFGALTVYLADSCSSHGIFGAGLSQEQAQERYVDRARRTLEAIESAALEHELLTGVKLPLNPHLNDGEGTFPHANTAVDVVEGIASLENEIADSGRQGMIHMTPAMAVKAGSLRAVCDEGDGYLRTINGTIVVPGMGYAGLSSPSNHPAGHTGPAGLEEWIYATGPIEARRTEIVVTPGDLREALDREINRITYRVERYYVVDWDEVVQAAVLVDRSDTP